MTLGGEHRAVHAETRGEGAALRNLERQRERQAPFGIGRFVHGRGRRADRPRVRAFDRDPTELPGRRSIGCKARSQLDLDHAIVPGIVAVDALAEDEVQ